VVVVVVEKVETLSSYFWHGSGKFGDRRGELIGHGPVERVVCAGGKRSCFDENGMLGNEGRGA
jgi:hypothetical protein